MLRALYPHSFTEFSFRTHNGVFEALLTHYLEVLLCFKRQPLMSSPMLSVSFNRGLKTSLPTGNRQIWQQNWLHVIQNEIECGPCQAGKHVTPKKRP